MMFFIEDFGAETMLLPLLDALPREQEKVIVVTENIQKAKNKFDCITLTAFENTPEKAKEMLQSYNLSHVIVGTSENRNSFAFKLTDEARSLNINTIGAVDSPANADYRFKGDNKNPLAYAPEKLWVVDQLAHDQFATLGFPIQNIEKVGHPFYWKIAQDVATIPLCELTQFKEKIYSCNNNDKVILFLGEISTGLDEKQFQHENYRFKGTHHSTKRTNIIFEELILAIARLDNIKLFVRPHPKEELSDYSFYQQYISGFITEKEDPISACIGADLVIGMSTSLLVESYFANCSVLSILPDFKQREWLNYYHEINFPIVATRKQLTQWINQWYHQSNEIKQEKKYNIDQNPVVLMQESLKNA